MNCVESQTPKNYMALTLTPHQFYLGVTTELHFPQTGMSGEGSDCTHANHIQ